MMQWVAGLALLFMWTIAAMISSINENLKHTDAVITRIERHLPSECAEYYNTGESTKWQECMGVGPK